MAIAFIFHHNISGLYVHTLFQQKVLLVRLILLILCCKTFDYLKTSCIQHVQWALLNGDACGFNVMGGNGLTDVKEG